MSHLLAQESVSVEAQLRFVFESLTTIQGALLALLALIALALAVAFKRIVPVASGVALYMVTYQLNAGILANQLWAPLQSIRVASKSVAFVLLLIAAAFIPSLIGSGRSRRAGATATAFWFFQVFYAAQLAIFAGEGFVKGLFGIVSMSMMYIVFARGFGKSVSDPASVVDRVKLMLWVAAAFVATNVVQLVVDQSGALMAGRLAGIAGNAQMMGAISLLLLLANCFLFAELPSVGVSRWVCVSCICVLSALVLATGSRAALLAAVVGVLVIYRRQLGMFLLIAIVVAVGYLALALVLEDSSRVTFERLQTGENTREAGWAASWAIFRSSPVFGEFPYLEKGQSPDFIESTFLRTLSNMGLVGGVVLAVPVLLALRDALIAWQLSRREQSYRRVVDFYLGSCAALLVLNVFDGYGFGFLTFPVLFMYLIFSLGGFLVERAKSERAEWDTDIEPEAD